MLIITEGNHISADPVNFIFLFNMARLSILFLKFVVQEKMHHIGSLGDDPLTNQPSLNGQQRHQSPMAEAFVWTVSPIALPQAFVHDVCTTGV